MLDNGRLINRRREMKKSVVVSLSMALGSLLVSSVGAQTFTMVDGGNETRVVDGWVNDVSDSYLHVGETTSGNALHIINGGKVYDAIGYVGSTASSSNNYAWVAGTGSIWQNSNRLTVGSTSSGNSLLVELGGHLNLFDRCWIGASNGHNNHVTVQDTGSLIRVDSILSIGNQANNNSLSVLNGAEAWLGGTVDIGESGGDNNELTISGAGSKLLIAGEYIPMNVGDCSGTTSLNCISNRVLVAEGAEVVCHAVYVGHGQAEVIDNRLTVSGSNSTLTVSNELHAGFSFSRGNRILIENGGRINSASAGIGTEALSSRPTANNSIKVTGEGSVWNNSGNVTVGTDYWGLDNALEIEDSGSVFLNTITVHSRYTTEARLTVSDGLLAAERITVNGGNIFALTNAVLQWTNPDESASFAALGGAESFSGTNQIEIAVASRSAMENISLDLISGLDNPADTNFFEVLFLDTSTDQLYRPEGASYGFDTNTVVWSISTDSNTEFVPTPLVPILSIDISSGNVNVDARYLLEETTFHLQSSTNLISGNWNNLYEISGTSVTNWSMPSASEPGVFYRMQSD